jgi:hypothetical protein
MAILYALLIFVALGCIGYVNYRLALKTARRLQQLYVDK